MAEQFWNFDRCTLYFSLEYTQGQSYERTLESMQKHFPTRPGDQDLLLEGIQSVDPGYTITAQDEAERAERREISEIARNNAFAHFHRSRQLQEFPENQSLARGLDCMFDVSGAEGAKEHNDRVRFLFAKQRTDLENGGSVYSYPNGTIGERSEVLKASLDRLFATDFNKLYTMTDREVAENFTKLYPAYIMMAEIDNLKDMNGKDFDLPQSYWDKMTELKWQHQGIIGSIKVRFEHIMNPNYEIFHYERMHPVEGRGFGDVGANGAEDLSERVDASPDALAFFASVNMLRDISSKSFVDKINHEIEKLNLPKEMLLPPEAKGKGFRSASPLLKIFLPGNGVELSTEDLDKGFDMVCFTNPATGLPHFLKFDGANYSTVDMSRLPAPLRSEPDKLMKALDNADPWYIRIFTGSKQFDEMKQALKAVQELKDQLPINPTAEQRKELAERLSTLAEKSAVYLGNKGGGVIQDDASDAERARITAAQAVMHSAMEGRALLGGYEQTLAFKANVHDEAFAKNDEGMKKQIEEEEGFARPRDFTKPGHLYAQEQAEKQKQEQKQAATTLSAFWSTQLTAEGQAQINAQQQKRQAEREARNFYTQGFADSDPLERLANNIYRQRGTVAANEEARAERIAQMVTLDIILRERQGQEKGQVGILEQRYRENPEEFVKGLERSAQLKKIAESIDAKDLYDMVTATAMGGIQQLTKKVLKEQGVELSKPQQPQLQQVAQNQPKAPEAPEPPKANIPNSMG